MGRYTQVDPIGFAGRDWNLFKYVYDNPLYKADRLGLWASGYGNYVHQRAGYLVYGKEVPMEDAEILAAAQFLADSDAYASTEMSFRHAMRAPNQSVAEACQLANQFVRDQYKAAREAQLRGDRKAALTNFGLALHALQDGAAPAHRFKVWDGNLTVRHVLDDIEVFDPSEKSPLMQATKNAWEWFKKGKLPDGDLFGCECE